MRALEESFFQLRYGPFSASPRADRYVPTPCMHSAITAMQRCVERCEGVAVLVGPAGCGKTLACRVLATRLRGRFSVILPAHARLGSRRELLQAVAHDLGLEHRGLDEGELRLSIVESLASAHDGSRGIVLVLDEAHALPLSVLEEARQLTNLMRDGEACVRLVLAGSPLLEERLTSPRLESLAQRIASRTFLAALDRSGVREFIQAQISRAGGDAARMFAPAAIDAVYDATAGVPRLVNQLCDHAMAMAYERAERPITAELVEAAWSNLQQLPAPWNERTSAASFGEGPKASVVEFGTLDDDGPSSLRIEPPSGNGIPFGPDASEDDDDFDEEFRPIGTIGPSPDASGAVDPFAESFQDEESILERYAGAHPPAWQGAQSVFSQEGQLLSSLLERALGHAVGDASSAEIEPDRLPSLEPTLAGGPPTSSHSERSRFVEIVVEDDVVNASLGGVPAAGPLPAGPLPAEPGPAVKVEPFAVALGRLRTA